MSINTIGGLLLVLFGLSFILFCELMSIIFKAVLTAVII